MPTKYLSSDPSSEPKGAGQESSLVTLWSLGSTSHDHPLNQDSTTTQIEAHYLDEPEGFDQNEYLTALN